MTGENPTRSLEEVFKSIFHNKMSFSELLALNIQENYEKIQFRKRTIYSPSSKLKQIHRFINNSILEYADINRDVVYSYRKGMTARDAILKHSSNEIFFHTDICHFYNNIVLQDVQRSLNNQLSKVPINNINKYIDRILALVVVDGHIPIGFSTSPILSNICLYEFDCALQNFCKENNLEYTRYSDDIIISGSPDGIYGGLPDVVDSLLKSNVNQQLELNKEKTKTYKKGHNFKLLGLNILPNGVVTIPSVDKKEVETLLYFYLTDKEKFDDYFYKYVKIKKVNFGDKTIREHGVNFLSGKLISINSMDKDYISKLKRKYGNTIVDMFVRKSVK